MRHRTRESRERQNESKEALEIHIHSQRIELYTKREREGGERM